MNLTPGSSYELSKKLTGMPVMVFARVAGDTPDIENHILKIKSLHDERSTTNLYEGGEA